MSDLNNPIAVNDEGIRRVIQQVGIIGSDGGRSRVTNGGLDINIQDQYTDAIFIYFNQVLSSTTLATNAVEDAYTLEVSDATNFVIGRYLILFNPALIRFSTFFVIGVSGTTITLDSPLDVAYPSGTFADIATIDLNVDGSGTPEIFGIRGTTVPPGSVPIEFDLTRMMYQMVTEDLVTFGLFGDLTALTRGLLFRKRDGRKKNIWNIKTNDEIALYMFDYDVFQATNPAQGVNGLKSRLTFAGQSKLGVTVRLGAGEDGEVWVQDPLQDLVKFRILAQGHIVE